MSSSSSHAILPFAALFAQDDDSEPGVVWFEGENAYFETLSDVMVPGHKCLHGVGLGQTVYQDVEFPITIPIVYEPSATSMLVNFCSFARSVARWSLEKKKREGSPKGPLDGLRSEGSSSAGANYRRKCRTGARGGTYRSIYVHLCERTGTTDGTTELVQRVFAIKNTPILISHY